MINADIQNYNDRLELSDKAIADNLANIINKNLTATESKIWHAHPVWFIDGNPVVGYSKLKDSVRLLFWSGQSFDEPQLQVEGKFKAAEMRYKHVDEIIEQDLKRWLKKAESIQWDYKNLVKRKGLLERLK